MKILNKQNYLNASGITIISLVITIIVLLILAGVSVSAIFGNNGIINKASEAQNKVDQSTENEQEDLNNMKSWLDDKLKEKQKKYTKAKKDSKGILQENALYDDIIIPKGFKISDVKEEQIISNGLVILDSNGNEFVWVPVNYEASGELDDNGLDTAFKEAFKTNTTEKRYIEPYTKGYEGEDIEYLNMMKSVQKYKGFYIGRYSAGTTAKRTSNPMGSNDVVVKRDAYPYIYVGWGSAMNEIEEEIIYFSKNMGHGAVYLSQTLYPDTNKYTTLTNDTGVISTLCYGVQYDAIMKFVADEAHPIDSTTNSDGSKNWGNYTDNLWTIDRKTASYAVSITNGEWKKISDLEDQKLTKTETKSILLTTGASDTFQAKHIFDLAGNLLEWTMESYTGNADRLCRSGTYTRTGSDYPANFRMINGPTYVSNDLSFRIALYLKD